MSNPKTLLDQHEISPKKSLGQNFLHDPNTLEKIVSSAELMPEDVVVEIGPGTGTLTRILAENVRHVFSVEIDSRMRPVLEEQLADYDNVHFIFEDFLQVNVLELVGARDFVVVANIPYYITSPILYKLLDIHRRPRKLVMTMQMEIAERIVATPPDMNRLAVMVQFYGQAQIVTRLKAAVFWPRPEVESAVLRIDTYPKPVVEVPSSKLFFRVVQAGFSQKRKQLRNSFGGGMGIKAKAAGALLEKAEIDPQRRAETLSLEEWARLTCVYEQETT